jgi:hypothetical protein
MKDENPLTAVINFAAHVLLTEEYGFEFVACENMPDCGMGHRFHLVPKLKDLIDFVDGAGLPEIQTKNLTPLEKRRKAIEISDFIEEAIELGFSQEQSSAVSRNACRKSHAELEGRKKNLTVNSRQRRGQKDGRK